MPLHDARSLLALLGEHTLVPRAPLDELRPLVGQFPRADDLARELVRRGLLTKYQVNRIFQGRAEELVLGQYLLLEPLGEGGMGQVFKARHRVLDRPVALKLIRTEYVDQPEAVERFRRECRAAARLSHPNIILVHDAHQAGDVHFLAMEHLEGTDLGRLAKARGTLPVGEACEYVRQAALGLQHAHERGLVHRDVKPANLFLSSDGPRVKVLDLGLARLRAVPGSATPVGGLTRSGAIMGTPDYMAPEQAAGDSDRADARADVYSLGCTLYHLLAGRPPFGGQTVQEKVTAHLTREAAPLDELRPGLPKGLSDVVRRMMAKDPAARLQTCAEAAAALAPYCRELKAGPAAPPAPSAAPAQALGSTLPQSPAVAVPLGSTLPQSPLPSCRVRRRITVAAVAAVVLLLVGLAAFFSWRFFGQAGGGPSAAPGPASIAARPDPGRGPGKADGPPAVKGAPGGPQATPPLPPPPNLPLAPPPKHVAVRDGLAWPPAECVALLGDAAGRHWGEAYGVAFRPDGRVIATCDQVGGQAFIHLWDAHSLRERAAWTPAGAFAEELAYSPDGKLLAAVCGDGLRLWDAGDDGLSRERKFGAPGTGPGSNLFHLTFCAGGQTLLAWDAAGAVRRWRLTGGDPEEEGEPAPPRSRALAVSGDGRTEAYDRMDRDTGKHRLCVNALFAKDVAERSVELSSPAGPVALSADGKRLAARVGGDLRVWDLGDGDPALRKIIDVTKIGIRGEFDYLPCFLFTPDGRRVAVAASARAAAPAVWLFDATTGEGVRLEGLDGQPSCLAVAADGRAVAVVGRDRRLRLWEDKGGGFAPRPNGPAAAGRVRRLAFRRGGAELAALSRPSDRPDGGSDSSNLIVWDLARGEARRVFDSAGRFTDCAYDPDGARLLAVGTAPPGKDGPTSFNWVGFLRVWQADSLTEEGPPALPKQVQWAALEALAYDREGKTLALLGGDNYGRKACVCDPWPFRVRGKPFELGSGVESLALAPDGATAAALGVKADRVPYVRFWDLKNVESGGAKEVTPDAPLEGAVEQTGRGLTFAPDGKTLAAIMPLSVMLWDVATGKTRAASSEAVRLSRVEAFAFSPDGRTLATADLGGRVALWRTDTGAEVGEWKFPGSVHGVAFDASGTLLAAGDADGTVAVLRLPAPAPAAGK